MYKTNVLFGCIQYNYTQLYEYMSIFTYVYTIAYN
nr:MAG TPA: hypothetical protein [Caudoviricetes sp.]